MPTFYISWVSRKFEPVIQKLAAACESYLEGKCLLENTRTEFTPKEIKAHLAKCDALFIVIGGEASSVEEQKTFIHDPQLNERLRYEVVTAMNLDLLIVLLLMDNAVLPEKQNAPGAWKRLLESKSYRLSSTRWSEDLKEFLEGVEEELEFKKEIQKKLSQSIYQNYQDLKDSEGRPLQPLGLGLEFSGALELRRIIESERFNLEEAHRLKDRAREKNALSALALAFTKLGQTQRAIQYFQEQLVLVREIQDTEEECGLLASLGDAYAVSGNIEAAKKSYEEQLLLADANGLRASVGSAYNGLGYVYVKQEKISRAIECYLKALTIYREFENHEKELELQVGIGLNYQKIEAWEQAVEYLEQALRTAKYLENRKEEAHILADLTEAHCRLEDSERARSCLDRADELLRYRNDEPWIAALNHRFSVLRESLKQK